MPDLDALEERLRADAAVWREEQEAREQALAPHRSDAESSTAELALLIDRPVRHRRSRWVVAAVAAVVVAVLALGTYVVRPKHHPAATTATSAQLVGPIWRLVSYRETASTPTVPVTVDSELSLSAKGGVSIHACNFIGGSYTRSGDRITVALGGSTDMLCRTTSGKIDRLDDVVTEFFRQRPTQWSINDDVLILTSDTGAVLTYRLDDPGYPDPAAQTLMTGTRNGQMYRVSVSSQAGQFWLSINVRTSGSLWGGGGVASPAAGDCLADSVSDVSISGTEMVGTFATPDVARVVAQATASSDPVALKLYALRGTSHLRAAVGWVPDFRPSVSTVTYYDSAGGVIARYPNGPC